MSTFKGLARVVLLPGLLAACGDDPVASDPIRKPPPEPPERESAVVTHRVAPIPLDAGEERLTCYSWTLDNDAPLYVDAVTLSSLGSFHHSNWLVVPESVYEGPDGVWDCEERGFDEQSAALAGTVLFAQSTQAWTESMEFGGGEAIRIPRRAKIVAQLHLLNLAPTPRETEGWLTMTLRHPYLVDDVLVPMQLTNLGLEIPAASESRFTMRCPGEDGPEPFLPIMKIHYALPHFHGAANYFDLTLEPEIFVPQTQVVGSLVRVEGFGAQPLGAVFDPPIEVLHGMRLSMTCGYQNPYDQVLSWGFGIDEMCVTLLLVSGVDRIYSGVSLENGEWQAQDGVATRDGSCLWLSTPTGLPHAPPSDQELRAPLYVPPGLESDERPPAVPACVDADVDAEPVVAPSLQALREHVFTPWCGFSACHGAARAAGLDLVGAELYTSLLDHEVRADTPLPLVEPGDPEGSWLYQVLSRCTPEPSGNHMPLNAPVLLEDETVALVRAWIEDGAPSE